MLMYGWCSDICFPKEETQAIISQVIARQASRFHNKMNL